MPTVTIMPGYYVTIRALMAPVLTRVQFGSSDTPGATEITDPIERPVTEAEEMPDGRTLRLHFLLEAGAAPTGTVIREIGLLTEAGQLVLRRIGPALEVTEDLSIGDFFDLHV